MRIAQQLTLCHIPATIVVLLFLSALSLLSSSANGFPATKDKNSPNVGQALNALKKFGNAALNSVEATFADAKDALGFNYPKHMKTVEVEHIGSGGYDINEKMPAAEKFLVWALSKDNSRKPSKLTNFSAKSAIPFISGVVATVRGDELYKISRKEMQEELDDMFVPESVNVQGGHLPNVSSLVMIFQLPKRLLEHTFSKNTGEKFEIDVKHDRATSTSQLLTGKELEENAGRVGFIFNLHLSQMSAGMVMAMTGIPVELTIKEHKNGEEVFKLGGQRPEKVVRKGTLGQLVLFYDFEDDPAIKKEKAKAADAQKSPKASKKPGVSLWKTAIDTRKAIEQEYSELKRELNGLPPHTKVVKVEQKTVKHVALLFKLPEEIREIFKHPSNKYAPFMIEVRRANGGEHQGWEQRQLLIGSQLAENDGEAAFDFEFSKGVTLVDAEKLGAGPISLSVKMFDFDNIKAPGETSVAKMEEPKKKKDASSGNVNENEVPLFEVHNQRPKGQPDNETSKDRLLFHYDLSNAVNVLDDDDSEPVPSAHHQRAENHIVQNDQHQSEHPAPGHSHLPEPQDHGHSPDIKKALAADGESANEAPIVRPPSKKTGNASDAVHLQHKQQHGVGVHHGEKDEKEGDHETQHHH